MGYNIKYSGEFRFLNELKASQLARVKNFLGGGLPIQAIHPCMTVADGGLELLDDFSGVRWDGSPKMYLMTEVINALIKHMEDCPDFELYGKMIAQGEDIDDRYEIVFQNSKAIKVELKPLGTKADCPHCGRQFYIES